MPHFSFSKQNTSDHFSSIIFNFCFSIFSHPLYFSYFIFFSPYILKLVSFLSPLFITTTLLLLALFIVSPSFLFLDTNGNSHESEFSDSKLGFLHSSFQTLILWLHSKTSQKDEESGCLEEFEANLVMFQAFIFQALESKPHEDENSPQCLEFDDPVDKYVTVSEEGKSPGSLCQESEELSFFKQVVGDSIPTPCEWSKFTSQLSTPYMGYQNSEGLVSLDTQVEIPLENQKKKESEEFEDLSHHQKEEKASGEMKILESLFIENEEDFEGIVHKKEAKFVESEKETKLMDSFKKVECEGENKVLEGMLKKEENEEKKGKIIGVRSGFKVMSKSQRVLEASLGSPENNWVYSESNHLGSFGSMRKEKEWRRTLACKLFEERHNNSSNKMSSNNVNGSESEGMDSLWETYETESSKPKNNNSNKKKMLMKTVLEKSYTKKSTESKYYDPEDEYDDEDDEEEEGEEGIKLCCLQALKFSTGKMNLGMGKPNLMKISKAFKGIGWLHQHVGKHGRKG